MSLPIVISPVQEKWDCHQCGICCHGSIIPLSHDDLDKLERQGWAKHPDFVGKAISVGNSEGSHAKRLAQTSDGRCVFLNEQGLCRIHIEYGHQAKPTTCRVFPLQLVPLDTHCVLTVRRACPSASADLGKNLEQYRSEIQRLVRTGELDSHRIDPPAFKRNECRSWQVIRAVLESSARLLLDDRYPPVRRLVHAVQLGSLLEKAKTSTMSDDSVIELVHALEGIVTEESKYFFEERQRPSWYASMLFRQIATEFSRLHPEFRPRRSWTERLSLMQTAWRSVRGRGRVRTITNSPSLAKYEMLDEPLGAIDPQIDIPLTRLIETLSASFVYAIADRKGWTILDSLLGLVVLYPVGLWLLRLVSHGRAPQVQDMISITVALDRGQGFRNLTGKLHRRRLSILASQNELERLIIWYAR